MTKRITLVVATASAAASLLVACGSSAPRHGLPSGSASSLDAAVRDEDSDRPAPLDASGPGVAPDANVARLDAGPCGDDVAPNADCSAYAIGARCAGGSVADAGGGGCCVCGGLSCSRTWLCGSQAMNDPQCPPGRPAPSLACAAPSAVACSYCSDSAPVFARCAPASQNASCTPGGPTPCWNVTPAGGICD